MIINLTPHTITIIDGKSSLTIPSSGVVRTAETVSHVGWHTVPTPGGPLPVRVVSKTFGDLEGLPDEVANTVYVVSALAAQAAWAVGRYDVLCPGDPVRDAEGKVIGCASLCCAPNLPEDRDVCAYCGYDNGPSNRFAPRGPARQSWDCAYCGGN